MQITFIQLDVPHTVMISLHVLIMQHVSKLYKLSYHVFSPVETSACLLLKIAMGSTARSNSNANVCAVAVVHAGSMEVLGRFDQKYIQDSKC